MISKFHRNFFCCLSLTNCLISKLRLPYIGVISAIVQWQEFVNSWTSLTPGGGQRQFSRGPPPPVCQNPSLRKQFSSANSFGQPSPNHRPRFSPPPVSRRQEDHIGGGTTGRCRTNLLDNISDDPKKVDFLNQVTKDILHKGYFTEKAIKRALESQLIKANNSSEVSLTSAEKSELVGQLKQQFGLDQSSSSKTRSSRASAVLEKRSSSDSSSLMSNSNNNKPSCIIINRVGN